MRARRTLPPPGRPARAPLVSTVIIEREAFGAGWDVRCPRTADCAEFDTIEEARAHADAVAARFALLVEERS